MLSGLTFQQVAFFRTAGFFKITGAVPADNIDRIRLYLNDEFEREVSPLRRDTSGRVIRLDGVTQRLATLGDILLVNKLGDALESLLGPNIVTTLNRHNHATKNYHHHDN